MRWLFCCQEWLNKTVLFFRLAILITWRGIWRYTQNRQQNWPTMEEQMMALNKELLDLLACATCKGTLGLTQPHDGLICHA